MVKGTVRIVNEHGLYAAWSSHVDRAIERYLPASPGELRDRASQALGHTVNTSSVSELLVMLASPEAGLFTHGEGDTDQIYKS